MITPEELEELVDCLINEPPRGPYLMLTVGGGLNIHTLGEPRGRSRNWNRPLREAWEGVNARGLVPPGQRTFAPGTEFTVQRPGGNFTSATRAENDILVLSLEWRGLGVEFRYHQEDPLVARGEWVRSAVELWPQPVLYADLMGFAFMGRETIARIEALALEWCAQEGYRANVVWHPNKAVPLRSLQSLPLAVSQLGFDLQTEGAAPLGYNENGIHLRLPQPIYRAEVKWPP